MRYLAKSGFSQSYTYFTWRNTKAELDRVLHRAHADRGARVHAAEPVREHARHPARVPAARGACRRSRCGSCSRRRSAPPTASTAASSCRRTCRSSEGSEEYLDSEKYQIRPRDFEQAGSLAELDRRGSTRSAAPIRRCSTTGACAFHQTDNAAAHLLQQAVGRRRATSCWWSSTSIRSACSTASCSCRWRTGGSTSDATVEVLDLLSGERYFWRGEWNYVRLDPQSRVAHILHVSLPHPVP